MSKFALFQVDKKYNKIRRITARENKFTQKEINKLREKFNMRLKQEKIKK